MSNLDLRALSFASFFFFEDSLAALKKIQEKKISQTLNYKYQKSKAQQKSIPGKILGKLKAAIKSCRLPLDTDSLDKLHRSHQYVLKSCQPHAPETKKGVKKKKVLINSTTNK